MAFSDFPPKDKTIKYWSKAEYYEYLSDYAQHFQLHPHIKLGTVVKDANLNNDKKWEVVLASTTASTDEKDGVLQTFDYLIVATGANQKPVLPPIFDGFKGEILHSSDYHSGQQVKGKKVLVVGTGESASDVAHSAGKVASSVTVWGRHYPSMAPRFNRDMIYDSNCDELEHLAHQEDDLLPNNILETMATSRIVRNLPLGVWSTCLHMLLDDVKNKHGDHSAQRVLYDLDVTSYIPDKSSSDTATVPTKSMIMAVAAARGEIDIAVAPRISCEGSKITFHEPSYFGNDFTKDPDEIDIDVDVIVACTGYGVDLSWLNTPSGHISPSPRTWFKHCFPPSMGEHVAFLGYARPHSGGIPQCSEMLARYIAQLRIGAVELPRNYAEIAKQDGGCEDECFHLSAENALVVDYLAFVLSVARLIGCTPKMPWNPVQIVKYWTFPLWPCFFRTQGPGENVRACDEVLNKFGPYDALAPMPFLFIEVIFSFLMPFVNAFSFLWNAILDLGKQTTLPRGYKWRMSKSYFLYSELRMIGLEDIKFAIGQVIAASMIFQHMIRTGMFSS